METLTEAPKVSSFIPLVEHQSATPASFYSGPPVLHYYSDRCKLIILESDLSNAPALSHLVAKASSSASNGSSHSNGDEESSEKVVEDIDVWVTSDKLLLYSSSLAVGVSIPYPTISLHAIQSLPTPSAIDDSSQGLYMQLVASPDNAPSTADDDYEPDSISATIIPTASAPPVPASAATEENADAAIETESQPEQTPVQALFNALSNCSNLHPDPMDDEDEGMDYTQDGIQGSRLYQAGLLTPGSEDSNGLPPPMPGSGGWITAENMHEYFDEDGNPIMPTEDEDVKEEDEITAENLGPGAGTVRGRDGEANGHDDEMQDDETKWRRTE